jgi:L-2-hydroxyglutarate oxidase LhgO
MERVDAVVIGAGVVGLAVARRLALAGREVLVLEKADAIGTETSSRNSEVIHAGIYYPTGSLKARTCVEGKDFLYRYCDERGVPYRRCGKLIVATNEVEEAKLKDLQIKAAANGVELEWRTGEEAMSQEPELFATAALWSPTTGIIDSHSLMLAYQGDAENEGAMLCFETPVVGLEAGGSGIVVETGGAEPMTLEASIVVNAAGLDAPALTRVTRGLPEARQRTGYLCKGNYYVLAAKAPFSTLIYPMPEKAGLGVHITLDLGGRARFGPDTEWIESLDYQVDPRRAEVFYDAIRRYWPGLPDGSLEPGYAGIRPKLSPAGSVAEDFEIQGPAEHGISGLVNLLGIESPGLTASPAIADRVALALGINSP